MVTSAWGRFLTGVPTLVDLTGGERSWMAAREGDPPARATTGSRAASRQRFSAYIRARLTMMSQGMPDHLGGQESGLPLDWAGAAVPMPDSRKIQEDLEETEGTAHPDLCEAVVGVFPSTSISS